MAHRVSLASPRAGAHYVSRWPGLGIPGAEIPTTGDSGASPLANDDITPTSVYRLVIKTRPSAGKLTLYPDTSLLFTDAPAGAYSMIYEGFEDGISYGEIEDPLYLGAVDATATGGTGTSTGAGSGGSATGQVSGVASGGAGTSTGSGTGGDATGAAGTSATATGGTGTSTGSGTGGAAVGEAGGSATAAGGTGTGTGTGTGGTAIGQVSGVATGGTGTSTGSGTGGDATGASADATAAGGTGTSTGSGTGGAAIGQGDTVPPGPLSHYVRPPRRVWLVKPTHRCWIVRPDKHQGDKMPLPTKDPEEVKTITFDFTGDAETIASATVTAQTVAGLKDTGAAAVLGTPSIDGAQVRIHAQAGLDGSSYGLRCKAVDADGEIHIATALLPVKTAPYA